MSRSMSLLFNSKVGMLKDMVTEQSSSEVIDFLLESGVIDEKVLTRYLIKCEYYRRLKTQNQSCFAIKMDLAADFDVSLTTVKNIIYKYDQLKV